MWRMLLAVFIGSGLGGVCRYLMSDIIMSIFPQQQVAQWATLTVNIAGCFILGLIFGFIDRGCQVSPEMRVFLTAGFCGGLTTFSTFARESVVLLGSGQYVTVAVYLALSLLLGLGAAASGHMLASK